MRSPKHQLEKTTGSTCRTKSPNWKGCGWIELRPEGDPGKRRNDGNEIMLILPRNIQALACCAGACLQSSFCTWGNFNRRKWGIFNRRKLGNIQPALTIGGARFELVYRRNRGAFAVNLTAAFPTSGWCVSRPEQEDR